MLVKLLDHKGRPRWVNPLYVKMLVDKGDETEIDMSGLSAKLRVKGRADDVALALDAAMPDLTTAAAGAVMTSNEDIAHAVASSQAAGGANAAMLG